MGIVLRRKNTISMVLRYIFAIFFLFLTLALAAQEQDSVLPSNDDIEKLTNAIVPEAQAQLLNLTLGDSDVSLFLSGYWKGTLSGNFGVSLTPLGWMATSTDSPILFTQEADLTLSLWIRERWFVEASFLDDYALNTYRAGYQGKPGEFVQYVGVGNTGLDFPVYPYLDLGGDSGSSVGVYGRFGTEELTIHSLFRYDAAVQEERVYVGNRERTFSYISVESPVRGRSFVLPDDNLNSVPVVYIEDSKGSYIGSDNRKYRMAANSELAASAQYGIIELANSTDGRVVVAYTKGGLNNAWNNSMGEYGDPPNTSFLGSVQEHFFGYDLTIYAQPGQENPGIIGQPTNRPGSITINGSPALVVYEPGTFSPFERQNRYNAPSSNTTSADLVTLSTGDRISGYEVLPLEGLITTSDIQLALGSQSQRNMYELTKYGNFGDRRSTASRWPLTDLSMEIYLPNAKGNNQDMSIRFTNYGSAGSYSLGTEVVPGSVKVYRGGIEDPRFVFNADTGLVVLEYPAAFNETIRITYLKQNNQRQFGSLAGGIGIEYDPDGPLSTALALGVRWNVNDNAFSEAGLYNQGTVGLSGQVAWTEENLKAKVTLGTGIDQPDTTGLYRVAGMEGSSKYIDIYAINSFISEVPEGQVSPPPPGTPLSLQNRADLVYRNYRESNFLGSSTLNPIEWSGAKEVSSEEGPYPVWDNVLKREVLVAEFTLNSEKIWAGFQSPLGDGHGLNNAEKIEIPLRLYDFNTSALLPGDFEIKVQFGFLKDQDNQFGENPAVIITETIYSYGDAEVKPIILTDVDRGKLRNANYMRVFIDGHGKTLSGRMIVAPPVIWGATFRPVEVDPGNSVSQSPRVNAKEIFDSSLRSKYSSLIDRLHPDGTTQQVLNITWWSTPDDIASDRYKDIARGVDTRVPWIPLINYDTLSFFVKGPAVTADNAADAAVLHNADLYFYITQGPTTLNSSGKTRLAVKIPGSAFTPSEWSKVEIQYNGGSPEVRVSGVTVHNATVEFHTGAEHYDSIDDISGQQSYMIFFLKPAAGDTLPNGSFSIDEVILENSIPAFKFNAGTAVDWHIPGTILTLGKYELLKDVTIQTSAETAFRGNTKQTDMDHFAGLLTYSKVSGTILDTRVSGNLRVNTNSLDTTWNAGYGIARGFGPLSFTETFYTGSLEESLWHDFALDLSTKFKAGVGAAVAFEDMRLDRSWKTYAGIEPFEANSSGARADFSARWVNNEENPDTYLSSFGESWLQSWDTMVPDAGQDADRRNAKLSLTGRVDTKPLGALILLEGESTYNKIQSTTISNSNVRMDLPFSAGKVNGVFRMERSFNWGLNYSGDSLYDDSEWYINSLKASGRLWASVPVYSLFNPNLYDSMETIYDNSTWGPYTENSRFNDLMGINLQFPQTSGLVSFFIPSVLNVQLNRSLHQKLDTVSDVLNINTSLRFFSVNLFGAFGAVPIMKFYQSDEFSNRLEGSVAFPRGEDISWQLLAGQSVSFFGFTDAVLALDNTMTLTDQGWSESLKIDWLVPTKKSLLSVFYNFLMGKALGQSHFPALADMAAQPFSQLRNESLELSINKTEDDMIVGFQAGHESIIRIQGKFYFSVFAKLSTLYYSETEILSFIATLGTTLNISF